MDIYEKTLIIKNKQGLHARPAALFVQIANKYEAEITVTKGRESINGKSIMGILTLEASKGTTIDISARGLDAKSAVEELAELVGREE